MSENNMSPEGIVCGRNAVRELLWSGREIDKLFIQKGEREGSIRVIIGEALNRKIPIVEVERQKLDELSDHTVHQGVAAYAAEKEYSTIEEILDIAKSRGEKPLVIIADEIEDPHNLGAIIRTAECAGAHGIIIPKRRSATLTPLVSKVSAGALAHMAIARETNITASIEKLKKLGLWIFGAEAGGQNYYEADFNTPAAIVFGSEGAGISRLVKEKCDFIVSIPIYGKINSLNVSAAAAVIINEAVRQQRKI